MKQANFAHSDPHCCLLLFLKNCQLTQEKNFNLVEILTIEIDRLRAAGECEPVMTSSSCCDDVTLVCSLQKYRHHHSFVSREKVIYQPEVFMHSMYRAICH